MTKTTDPAVRSYKLLVIAALAAIYSAALYTIIPSRAPRVVSAERERSATKSADPVAPASAAPAVRRDAQRVAEAVRPRTTRVRTRSS
jgi:hypothetical protein